MVDGLLADLFDSFNIGLAVVDDQLRYRALNTCLAAMHGVSAESHLGKTVREILGDNAFWVERVLILSLAKIPSSCEINAPWMSFWASSCLLTPSPVVRALLNILYAFPPKKLARS
ncbi:MAG: hypothetical protein JWO91_137 [Acidobacteriaceae bacterium]|nr:hypothetical protein [Acidobacteriaceae bacterium]